MSFEWHNINKERPKFTKEFDGTKYSEQTLFLIDEHLYIGYYEEVHSLDDEDKYFYIIEVGSFEDNYLTSLGELQDGNSYISQDDISNKFEKHEIYWSKIDILDILLNVDLLKKQEKENG